MSEVEIIQLFNQKAFDMFSILIDLTTRMGKEREYKFSGYKQLFDNAVKINIKFAIG